MAGTSDVIGNLEASIGRVGWGAVHVFPTDDQPEPRYSFTYTIGFWPAHAEVIILNLPKNLAWAVLAELYARITTDGTRFEADKTYGGLLRNYDATFVAVSPEQRAEHFRFTAVHHDTEEFDALQLVWPALDGKFPWEPDYNGAPQPVLS